MTDQPTNAFAEACGLSGPLGLFVKRPGEEVALRYAFEQPFALIGRDPRADLCLEGQEVSRRHVYLQVVAGHVYCMDLDSRTGTYWDDAPRAAGWLVPGQVIRVGPHEVCLESVGRDNGEAAANAVPDWNPIETRQPDATAGRRASIEVGREGRVETRCRLTRLLTLVGRAPACRLRLRSQEVSSYHCALLRTPAAVWVIDLLGRGGIRVNGARLVCCPLVAGDRVRVGDFEMRLRFPEPAADPAASADNGRLDPTRLPAVRAPIPLAARRPFDRRPEDGALDAAELGPVVRELRLMQQGMFDHFHQALMTMMQVFGTVHQDQMGLIREELERIHALSQELQELRSKQARQAPASPAPGPAAALSGRTPRPAGPPAPAAPQPANGAAGASPATSPGNEGIHVWLSQRIEALEQEQQSRWQKVVSFMLGK